VKLTDLDDAGLAFARTRGHSPGLDRAVAAYSRLGEHAAGWIALGLVGAVASGRSDRRRAWLLSERRRRRCAARHRGCGHVAGRGSLASHWAESAGVGRAVCARPTGASRPLLLGPQ
jgi:hypothetical protein